jgi:hypothetical protein
MSLNNYFRALLCVFLLLVIAEVASDIMTVGWLPEPLRKHVEEQMKPGGPVTPDLAILAMFSLLSLSLMLVSLIGLWLFWRPARMLYTLCLLTLGCAVAASGTVVESALTTVLSYMNTVIAGVILGMIYFSPVREHFEAPAADQPPA